VVRGELEGRERRGGRYQQPLLYCQYRQSKVPQIITDGAAEKKEKKVDEAKSIKKEEEEEWQ
jgi:hypothetical protein